MSVLIRSWSARFVILAAIAAAAFLPRLEDRGSAIFWSAGLAAVIATGIGLIRMSRRERADLQLLNRSDGLGTPIDGERVAFCGKIETEFEPVLSPVRKAPSVLYHYEVYHHASASPGAGGGTKTVIDFAGWGAAPFRIVRAGESIRLGSFPHFYGFDERRITSETARNNLSEYFRSATLVERAPGKIEWVHLEEDMWDGRSRIRKDFRQGEGRPIDKWWMNESAVTPGEPVCAIGVWSAQRGALVDAGDEKELWLYRGTKDQVRQTVQTSVGCGRVLGFILIAGSVVAACIVLAG